MSTKAKSKPASGSSPQPGKPEPSGPTGSADAGRDRRANEAALSEPCTVYLVSDRSRRGSWLIGGAVVGALLVWKLGTVAATAGVVLIALALYHGWFFLRTLRFDAGSIVVHPDRAVELPLGLCRGQSLRVGAGELRAAYFLRRAVPWSMGAPVLVIETAQQGQVRAHLFPRDWFSSEADQRRVMHAVTPALLPAQEAAGEDGADAKPSA